jgi:hypothetical protein
MAYDYLKTRISPTKTKDTHVVVWEWAHGPVPKGKEVHHKNGNTKDNRLSNLELVTRSKNEKLSE